MAAVDSKKRAKQFSFREIEVLEICMEQHIGKINMKFSSGGANFNTKTIKDKIWAEITDKVNAVGNGPRTIDQVKQKWTNMVKTAKKQFTNERLSMTKTGGGPPIQDMSATSQGIVQMMSGFASFSGIPDASNSESMIAAQDEVPVDKTRPHLVLWEGISSMIATTDEGATADGDNAASNHDDENSTVVGATMARGPDIKPKATQSESTPSERPTTLKGLQMEYYRKSIQVQEAQLEFWQNCTRLAQAVYKKL